MAKKKKKKTPATPKIECHLISDAAGSLAWQIIKAVSTLFPNLQFELTAYSFVDSESRTKEILKKLKKKNVWVFHALLDADLKAIIIDHCRQRKLPCYDMAGGVIQFFADHSGEEPSNDPQTELDEGYFERLDALEFTLQHDDSRRLESLGEADIILVGISRVSKTPTSCYLGSLGFRVANVSFAPDIGLPKELKRRMKKKVVALSIQPRRLKQVRDRRMEVNKFDKALAATRRNEEFSYMSLKSVIREVMDAESIYRDRGFPIVDITDQTVEVTALSVLQELDSSNRFLRAESGWPRDDVTLGLL